MLGQTLSIACSLILRLSFVFICILGSRWFILLLFLAKETSIPLELNDVERLLAKAKFFVLLARAAFDVSRVGINESFECDQQALFCRRALMSICLEKTYDKSEENHVVNHNTHDTDDFNPGQSHNTIDHEISEAHKSQSEQKSPTERGLSEDYCYYNLTSHCTYSVIRLLGQITIAPVYKMV